MLYKKNIKQGLVRRLYRFNLVLLHCELQHDLEILTKPLIDSTATDEVRGFYFMKKCNVCKKEKKLIEFWARKTSKDLLRGACIKCESKRSKQFYRTIEGVILTIYSSQRASTIKRGHQKVKYTKSELSDWLMCKRVFIELYNNWVKNGYKPRLKPSVDRIDSKKGYSFDNIQLTTWGENRKRNHNDTKNGRGVREYVGVNMYSLDGVKISSYYSLAEASRVTGIQHPNIIKVCKGQRNHAGGFKWSYK